MAAQEKSEAKASAKAPLISQAPQPESSQTGSARPMGVDVIRDPAEGEALYWCGTLLKEGEFEMDWPASIQEIEAGFPADENGEYRKTIRTTAWNLWFPKQQDIGRFWASRNGFYNQLDVTGLSFPGFTERTDRGGTNELQEHRELWPGHIVKLSDSELVAALESVKNHALRPKGPEWKSHPGAEVVNYMSGHMPGCPGGRLLQSGICPKCAEIERLIPESNTLARRAPNTPPQYRRRGDLPFADYVYLLKLSAPVTTPRDLYYRLVPSMPQFFNQQPPPLARDLAKAAAEEQKAASVA